MGEMKLIWYHYVVLDIHMMSLARLHPSHFQLSLSCSYMDKGVITSASHDCTISNNQLLIGGYVACIIS